MTILFPMMVNNNNKPMTINASSTTTKINAILAGCNTANSIKEFTNDAKRKYGGFFPPLPKYVTHIILVILLLFYQHA